MAGLAVQPLVAAVLGFCLFPLIDYTGRSLYGGRPGDPWDAALSVGFGVGLAALPVVFFGALPALAVLSARGAVSRSMVIAGGVLLGNVPGALIVATLFFRQIQEGAPADLAQLTYGPSGLIRAVILGSLIGAGCAWTFWLIAGRPPFRGSR